MLIEKRRDSAGAGKVNDVFGKFTCEKLALMAHYRALKGQGDLIWCQPGAWLPLSS